MPWFCNFFLLFFLQGAVRVSSSVIPSSNLVSSTTLSFDIGRSCTYSYQVAIHTARGSHSTESQGHEIHMMIDVIPVARQGNESSLHINRLNVYQPRIRRLRGNHVLANHPVNEELEKKLSNPFYFRQHDHGPVVDVLFPKSDEPRVVALKKGIAGAFQVHLKSVVYDTFAQVEEHDDSGVYKTRYTTLLANDSHTTVKREWTNNDYLEFADGTPVRGEHKTKQQYVSTVHIKDGKIHKVQRQHMGIFESQKGHPRAENKKEYQEQEQDIQVSTSGYNKLTLVRCNDVPGKEDHRRSRRSAETPENLEKDMQGLHQENLVFKDSHKINWKNVGGDKIKFRPFYELMRCFTDPTVKNREIGECARELHKLVEHDEASYHKICNLVLQRNHQNVTSWSVVVSALAGRGGPQAQSILAQALMSEYPRRLTIDEYETLLEGIFHIPSGPIHKDLFDALFTQATRASNHGHKSSMAMLVLAGLTKRADTAGYNSTLSDVVAELIHNSYHNKSSVYDPDSVDHEVYLTDHIWAFGNLGHLSGLEVMLKHANHDRSGVRSAVVSSMRKLPAARTNKFLLDTLYNDEENDVKAAVIDVFVERHEDLTDKTIQALEHAIWHAEDGDALDAAVQEFLENHHNHPKIQHIRKRRSVLRRQKRALIPALRPREIQLGPNKRWVKNFGGNYLGAESHIQFLNQVRLRIGIFGGNFEVNLDNFAKIEAHILKWRFDIVRGKAAFKASASFKNDIPKDLIHAIADAGDDILSKVDDITSIIFEQIQNIKDKLKNNIPLNIQKLIDFVNKIVSFVQNLFKPLKPINLMKKILAFVKKVIDRLKNWKWMIDKVQKIQITLNKLTLVDEVFKQVIAVLDRILGIVNHITLRLPHNLPANFKIEDLLKWLRTASLDLQDLKIKEFFQSLGFSVPGGFRLQLPFRFTLHFSLSMEKFTAICMRLVNFANNFLDISSIFDVLKNIRLPHLNLPQLEGKFPLIPLKSFNFGLTFDWKINLNFNLNLKDPGFMKLVNILGKLGEFLKQFKLPSFDLEKFFERIMPGKDLDLTRIFQELFRQNSNSTDVGKSPSDILQNFVDQILNLLDSSMPNITAISEITDFFQELGPAMKDFAAKSAKKICKVYKFALNSSRDFKDFGENLEKEGIAILKKVDDTTQGALQELLNYTIVIDGLIDEIEKNFTIASRGFVSKSLKELSKSLKEIQSLADQIVEFANGTSSKVTGVCMKGADFSANVIDEVQNASRDALAELTKFVGPVARGIKVIGQDLKKAVTKVEEWYNENMAVRVGKISKIARLVADFMSVLNTKKGFLGKVREISIKVNEVLTHMRNLPLYATKARETADEIIQFADRAQNFKLEIQKLDIRKEFGINYDKKVRDLCNEFKAMASQTLQKIGGYDISAEVNKFFTVEADKLISKAVTKFRKIKQPIYEIQGELKDISSMVKQIMDVLINLKPFTTNFSPILSTINKLPDCQQTLTIFTESAKPCFQKAMIVGKYVIDQYKDMRKEIAILKDMIPETWKNFKIQKCIKGGACISKAFIDQAKVIKEKVDVLKDKFKEASGYTDMLGTCQAGVENITQIIDTVKLLIKQVKEFDLKDDVQKVKDVLRRVTGRDITEVSQPGRVRRSIKGAKDKIKRVLDYIRKAKETKEKLENILRSTFKAMKALYNDAILEHVQKIQDVRNKLQTSYDLWKKTKDINSIIQGLDHIIKEASDYAKIMKSVTSKFSNPVVKLLLDTGELSDVIKPHMAKYIGIVKEATDKVNGFFDKISEFQNKIQLRQRGLNPSQYKEWSAYPYCSADVCVRSLRRSSSLYYSTIFTWKFPHLDDLSSMKDCGRWLIPGLFDDYKVEGIAQLSQSQMVLGMHGVSANKGKPSILVITNPGGRVRKIIQLGSPQSPFTEEIGGVSIARNSIWVSSGTTNKIFRINKGSVTGSMSSSAPSWVAISRSYNVEGTATSVSFDEATTMLWVTDGVAGKGYGYKLSPDGDLLSSNLAPDRVLVIKKHAQGMAIVRQFSTEYVVVSRCAMKAGFQCKLEFHDLSGGDEISENSLSRVVRTPSGLESVEKVKNDLIVIVFSSATYSERSTVENNGGDFEDRYFRLKLPILKMTFGITENCLYFKVMGEWIISKRRLFPFGDMHCGALRKRSIENELLESDIYSQELEEVHSRSKRSTGEMPTCMTLFRGNVRRGYHQFMPDWKQVIIVFGIPVTLFAGAGGYWFVDYQGQLCMRDRTFKVGLIPGAWIAVHAGASVSIWIVEAGITIEAILLETYLLPELTVKIDKWPLKACIELKLRMTPLKIRVWLWYRFRLCIRIRCKCFSCSIKIRWCSKKTFAEWWWSARQIERTLFSTCKKDVDTTPPIAGTCTARQVGDKSYFVQWHGFREDTSINFYWVKLGSIKGSGDDFGANVGTSLSTVVKNLPIMHGRDVYASVRATNDMGMDSRLASCPLFKAKRRAPQIRYVNDGSELGQEKDYQSDDYGLGMNFAWAKGDQSILDVKWGISTSSKCTLDENEFNVYGPMPVGETNSIQTSGLSLKHGQKYYTRVVATNSIGLRTVMCSDGIVIDTTPPVAGSLFDGSGEKDADFIPSTRRVRGKYQAFVDNESPLAKYEWKIATYENSSDVTPFVNIPLTQRTPLMEGLKLVPGQKYKIILRGTNAAGLQTSTESNGFAADNTAPVCDVIFDVLSEKDDTDVDFVRELKSIQAKWRCSDSESGIKEQLLAVGTYPGGEDIKPFDTVEKYNATVLEDGNNFVRVAGFEIKPRVRYHVTIKVLNGAGLRRTASSDGILIDTTPPAVASQFIKDGLKGKDQNYTKERFSFSVHWQQAFADAESGLAEYRVGLGTKPGITDTKNLISVGKRNNVTLTGLLLESGRKYYATVVGCNGVQMCVNASSNGAIVDYVPPHSGTVITGYEGPPVFFQWNTKSVWARWNWCPSDEQRTSSFIDYRKCSNDSFYDVHSGIESFGLSVTSLVTEQLLVEVKKVGRVRMSGRSIELEDGIYSAVVQATDKVGMNSNGYSNTFIVDSSPPEVLLIQHGHRGDAIKYTKDKDFTFKSYFEIEDDLTKIVAYKVSIGSYSGADDVASSKIIVLPQPQHSIAFNWTADKPTRLENNRKYYITVQAINSADLTGIGSSDALLSDSEAPRVAVVLDGWGMMDAKYQSYASLYRAHWHGISDFSGVQSIYLGLKSTYNSRICDVRPLELVPNKANFHILSGLNLRSGSNYFACMKVVDNAQNEAYFASNGVTIDNTPPLAGTVMDGKSGQDIDVQTEGSILWARWSNFTEQETEIVQYKLAFGTSPGKEDIQEFTDVELVESAASTRMKVSELQSGQRYYATVIAINNLGIPSAKVSSNGVLVDFTPPEFTSPVTDGTTTGADIAYTSQQTLSCSWTCEDQETSLKSVEVAFGLQPGVTNVKNFTGVPLNQRKYVHSTNLRPGIKYFAMVRCTNRIGLTSVSTSNGVTYDNSPPLARFIDDGDYQNSTNKIDLKWKFYDVESGIKKYQVFVHFFDNSNRQGPFEFPGSITSKTLVLANSLSVGRTYFVTATGINGAGLTSSATSDGFKVDNTPPLCNNVWDGDKQPNADLRFIGKTNRLTVSWNCYDNESTLNTIQFSVQEVGSQKVILPFHSLKRKLNSSGSAIITGNGKWNPRYLEGKTYKVGIKLTNAVKLSSAYWTNGVLVDTSPPVFNNLRLKFNPINDVLTASWKVKDEESGVDTIRWGLGSTPEKTDIINLTAINKATNSITISSSQVHLKLGKTYFFTLVGTNLAGLASRTVSNGVVIDRTKPEAGIVNAQYVLPLNYDRSKNVVPGSSFTVSWTGFVDRESGISQFSWATGENLQSIINLDDSKYTSISLEESVGGVQIMNVTLVGNTTYYVCIRATNGAGLQRTDCSAGMKVVLGKFSAGVVNDGPRNSKKDLDFQLDDRALWAYWSGFKDPVYGVSSFEWCIGDHQPNPSDRDICKWPYMKVPLLRNYAHRFYNLTLAHGTIYYATVKGINSRGESVRATSDGVLVDRTSPVGGSINVSPSIGKDTQYLTSLSAPTVTWDMTDGESGLSHFRIGVGSFPFQDDRLNFKRIESLERSVDLDQFNFSVNHGLSFFVTVTGVNMLGLESSLITQQVVVDTTPPSVGVVVDGNRTGIDGATEDLDYQTNSQVLSALWYGFEDDESDIVEYKWCIGLQQGTCTLTSFASSGLLTYASISTPLQEGVPYYFTVQAINAAGLIQTSSSDGVTVDTSLPVITGVTLSNPSEEISLVKFGNVTAQSSGRILRASWDKVTDAESDIKSLMFCVGRTNHECNIVDWTKLDIDATSVVHYFQNPLNAGTKLYVTLQVYNGAGLSVNTSSDALLVDSSPPRVGSVLVGNVPGTKYLQKDDAIEADWGGFEDQESGLDHFEWAVCPKMSRQKYITPFVNVGLTSQINNDQLELKPGISYVLVIRAYNKVGLGSEAQSNVFVLDNEGPLPRSILDGQEHGKDISIQSSANTLAANWEHFVDYNSRITNYEICVGSEPLACDIKPYHDMGVVLVGEITGLSLIHMKTYYVTVRATNEAGYQANGSTNGVKIDSTPPVGGKVRDGIGEEDIDYQADNSFISANWDHFTDTESGIEKYIWCAGTSKGSCDVIVETEIPESTQKVARQINLPISSGVTIYIKVKATNNAGGETTLYSDGVTIDNTPPQLNEIKDLQTNSTLQDKDFITSKVDYCATWNVRDKESGVSKSEVSVCSDLNHNDCLATSIDVGKKSLICMSNLKLVEGVKYVTIVRVTNNVGLSTTRTSDGFVLDSTPPITGEISHVTNGSASLEGLGRSFTSSDITVRLHGFWDKESLVSKYYACLGKLSGGCDLVNFTDIGNRTEFSFTNISLDHNTMYYVSVIAENEAGLRSSITSSDGVLMDATAPIASGDIYDGDKDGKDLDFQQSTTDIKAHWKPFEDPESDVVKVTWCAGTARGLCDIVPMKVISPWVDSVHIVLDSPMNNGQKFYVSVHATNGAHKTTKLASDGVTVDNSPPKAGLVLDGNTGNDISYLFGDDDVQAQWSGFADQESGIDHYEVAVCDARDLNNCPQPYTTVNNATHVRFTGLDIESGALYIVFVKATNFAGLQTESSSNGFTVDFTPPKEKEAWLGPGNKHFAFQSSDNQLHVRWSPFEDYESGIVKYEICASLSTTECNKTNFVNVGQTTSYVLSGLNLHHGKSYHVTIKGTNGVGLSATVITKPILVDTTPPKVLDEIQNQNDSDINPSLSPNGINNNSLPSDLNAAPTPSPYIRFTCTEELLSVDWDEFDDPESGMSKYEWCVGTRKGICDVFSLTSAALSLSGKAITNRISSGSQLFATVNVVNNVGLKTVLDSKKCLVITVAPKVIDVFDLEFSNSSDPADVDWMANMESLTLKWNLIGKFLEDISRMRLEVAVTATSLNRSLPSLNPKEGWNGEPFAQDFMTVHSSQRNVTVESVGLQPWKQYRGVVRVWNEGGIYDETSSDGVRVEPRPPLGRKLFIRDKSPENEIARWLPNLHLPPLNKSLLDKEVVYISSPSEISIAVSTGLNSTNSSELELENDLLDSGHFSPTQEFKVLVTRVTSDANETNTTEHSLEMKTLPGFSDPQGPCCANHTQDTLIMLSDNHFKPTLTTQKFGSSVVLLPHDYIAVASSDKFFIFSTKNRTLNREVVPMTSASKLGKKASISYSADRLILASDGIISVSRYDFDNRGNIKLRSESVISGCKTNPCVANVRWSKLDGETVVIQNTTIAASGRVTPSNNSVIGIFRLSHGAWQLHKVLGTSDNDKYFGQSMAMNDEVLAVSVGGAASPMVIIYSMTGFSVVMKIDLKHSSINMVEPSLRLTKQNQLVMVSKSKAKSVSIQLDIPAKSFKLLCSYEPPIEIRLSGNFDLMDRDGGTIVALGMQTSQGRDGVILTGFNGAFAYHPYHDKGKCINLGSIISRENHPRFDDGIPRASVSMYGSNIVFGTPGILTWPDGSENLGTGRVYTIKYCPRNFKRVKSSSVNGGIESYQCKPCEVGRKSLGGVSSICTVCEGRKCVSPLEDDPVHFTTRMCGNQICSVNEQITNKTNGIKIIQMEGTFFDEGAVNEYTVKLVETTRAGMSTTSESEPFIIDTSSPVVGTVYDGLGSDQDKNCSSNETLGEDSQCSTRSFQDTDIDYTNITSEVHARWIDFADNESDISEYFWCVGSKPMLDDIRQCEGTGQRQNGSHYGLDFKQGDTYYVTVVACNGAQRCSAAHSNGVTIDVTPPIMQYVRDGVLGPDMDYQVFLDIIFAYFKAYDEDSDISSYEVAWGTAPGLRDLKEFEEIGNTTTWFAQFKDNTLEKEKKYFATVRASNKAGLLSEPMSSDGIIVGKSEYIFDKNASASFFFDTVNINPDGTRKDGGVGKTYGTLDVPEGAVNGEIKLKCYRLDNKALASNKSEDGPVSNPSATKPKQFMLGNYSFQIKAVDPYNDTVQEGYKFAKPIKISMFYDVDNLVNANKRVVNNEVKKEDIDPVLYLWDIENNTWIDASLTCPEPWYHVNRTIKLLTVQICHLTQFAFFWSFNAQSGLMMFNKNTSVYNENGEVQVSRQSSTQKIDLPIKRSKGASGSVDVYWSLHSNESIDLVWPNSGKVSLSESQWNATLSLYVASDERKTAEKVIWVRLENATGGAILASRDMTSSKMVIESNLVLKPEGNDLWIIIGVCTGLGLILLVILIIFGIRKRKNSKKRLRKSLGRRRFTYKVQDGKDDVDIIEEFDKKAFHPPSSDLLLTELSNPMSQALQGQSDNASNTSLSDDDQLKTKKQPPKQRKKLSFKKKPLDGGHHQFVNPSYGSDFMEEDFALPGLMPKTATGGTRANVNQIDSDQSDAEEKAAKDTQVKRKTSKTGKFFKRSSSRDSSKHMRPAWEPGPSVSKENLVSSEDESDLPQPTFKNFGDSEPEIESKEISGFLHPARGNFTPSLPGSSNVSSEDENEQK